MTWKELMEMCQNQILVATATTGLKPDHGDELLAVSCCDPADGKINTYIRKVPLDKLLAAQQYHGISKDRVEADALSDELFDAVVGTMLREHTVFSYNNKFQLMFLQTRYPEVTTKPLYDLPYIYRCAQTRRQLTVPQGFGFDDVMRVASNLGVVPTSFRKLCEELGIAASSVSLLPVEQFVGSLQKIWAKLCEIPALVQETLL